MKGSEVRKKFLHYFEGKDHRTVRSSSLVPENDPTLLFTNAGMNQFKEVFLGNETRDYKRAASSQKCLRVSGKHNDLENVGFTARHHTFFEMLGNFSFGDYFKEGAIEMAWELMTQVYKLPKDKLYATIYKDDDEASELWQKVTGIPASRIYRLGEKDNFWSMGETGPCGPCSEIIIDRGEKYGCDRPDCDVGCDCDRYFELWNLVFMQYNRLPNGKLEPLPSPNIDTGMGLERITSIIQGVETNYDTDFFQPLIKSIAELANVEYGANPDHDIALKVIADHLRAIAFLIGDGVMPSNEGPGYAFRRIMRRAIRFGKRIGFDKPFLYKLSGEVATIMGDAYPELYDSRELTSKICQSEEEKFDTTLSVAVQRFEEIAESTTNNHGEIIDGKDIFMLYDTFGLPLDFALELANEKGLKIDEAGFQEELNKQRVQARISWKESKTQTLKEDLPQDIAKTIFIGYETLRSSDSKILYIFDKNYKRVKSLKKDEEGLLILDKTPFYGETGGQVGDQGVIAGKESSAIVTDTQRAGKEGIVHYVKIEKGEFKENSKVTASVNEERRRLTAANHTATHLLQAALRNILGSHVKQSGSLVSPDRLRFDFTHFSPLNKSQLQRIEALVNYSIQENLPVSAKCTSYEEALAQDAVALFGEKYEDEVRMITIENISRELCGGTHVNRTGDIGLFLILSESSVAAGIRRIEAVTAKAAIYLVQEKEETLLELQELLKTDEKNFSTAVEKLLNANKKQQKEIENLKLKLASSEVKKEEADERQILGITVVSKLVENLDPPSMRNLSDNIRDRIKSGIIILGSQQNSKANLIVCVTKDLINRIKADIIVKELAKIIDGHGGGKATMAQAGGTKVESLEKALEESFNIIEKQLKKST
jgi:alanyl-tRNA synthetase